MNLISQSQVKLHRQYHLVLTLHIKIDLFIYVPLHCCCHRKRKFVFLWLGNWLGGGSTVFKLESTLYRNMLNIQGHWCSKDCYLFIQRLNIYNALIVVPSKIVNTKVGPVIDIDKALLMTKLLHCFVIACKIVFCGQFPQRGWLGHCHR